MRKVKPVNPQTWALPNAKVPFLAPDVVTKVIPSPVEGWDAISPLAEMDPKRAPILDNFVPRPGFVELRGGYVPYNSANITATPVETLMVYKSPTTEKFFMALDSSIYDISQSGVSTKVVGSTTSDRWQYTNFTTSATGAHVIQAVNGADSLLQFDGTSWTNPSITGLPAGVTTANFTNITAQKQRLWYIIANSTVIAFMPVGNISGPIAGTQDFGLLWNKGGTAVAIADWTIDGGAGPQDYVAFISSKGQVSLYQGTDPTNAAAWSLVGTFDLPPPIGNRCVTKIGSDVAIITQQGVLPISQALPFDPSADRSIAITSRIQNAMAQAALNYQNNFGWELTVFPLQQLLILNVPSGTNTQAYQYVMNTLTGAWSRFVGWNANTFAIYKDNLYWGGNSSTVNQGYVSSGDFTSGIVADMQCAFNWLDEPGRIKRMTMVQPLLAVSSGVTPTLAVDEDFTTSTAVAAISTIGGTVLWDVAVWDQSLWPAASSAFTSFLSTDAIGHALAIRMRVNVGNQILPSLALFDSGQFDLATFDAAINVNLPVLQVNAFNSIAELGGAV